MVFSSFRAKTGKNRAKPKEQREENSQGSNENTHIHIRRVKFSPARWVIIPVNRRYNDDIPLKPHPDVHDNGQGKCGSQATSDLLEPEQSCGLMTLHVIMIQ